MPPSSDVVWDSSQARQRFTWISTSCPPTSRQHLAFRREAVARDAHRSSGGERARFPRVGRPGGDRRWFARCPGQRRVGVGDRDQAITREARPSASCWAVVARSPSPFRLRGGRGRGRCRSAGSFFAVASPRPFFIVCWSRKPWRTALLSSRATTHLVLTAFRSSRPEGAVPAGIDDWAVHIDTARVRPRASTLA